MRSKAKSMRGFVRLGAMVLILCTLCPIAVCLLEPTLLMQAKATEDTETGEVIYYIEPTLSANAEPYNPDKPDELTTEQLYAKSAILIEANTGEVIFEKNADSLMYPASTTKIMTTLLGIVMGDMNEVVYLSETAANVEAGSSTIPLEVGESINFEDLLYATMMRSGNEGANLIAETISGSNEAFAQLMTEAALLYGCTSTNFTNPSGLYDKDHYTTARDMATIASAAMQNETFANIAGTINYSLPRSNMQDSRVLVSRTSDFLSGTDPENEFYYPYATGIKTGYIAAAGNCFVASAEKNGVELISVVFYTSEDGRWLDTTKLMDYGFAQFTSVTPQELYEMNPMIIETTTFSMEDEDVGRLQLNAEPTDSSRSVYIVATQAEIESMAKNIRENLVMEYTRDFAAPIEEGEVFGSMTYYPTDGGDPVVYDLVAARSIERRENAPLSLEEIIEMVYSDPNPFPPLSVELVAILAVPVTILVLIVYIPIQLIAKRKGKVRKSRVPKPRNRYFR